MLKFWVAGDMHKNADVVKQDELKKSNFDINVWNKNEDALLWE